jgi:hypothetical protein
MTSELRSTGSGVGGGGGLGDVLGCGSPGLGLLLAGGEKEARQEESGEQTHIFPIAATHLFATLLSEWLAVSGAEPNSELLFYRFAH